MSDLMLNLKINHHSHAKDFVIAYTEWLSVNSAIDVVEPVSYTHLTLPTICSV